MKDCAPSNQRDEPQGEQLHENTRHQILLFIGDLALYLLIGLSLWWLLQLYVDPSAIKNPSKEATAKKDLLQALGLIMAGVAGAIGIFFTWRGQRITQNNLRLTQKARRSQPEEHATTRAIPWRTGNYPPRADHGALHTGRRAAW